MKSPNRWFSGAENKNYETTSKRRDRAAGFIAASGVAAALISGCGIGSNQVEGTPKPQELEWTSENVPEQVQLAGESMIDYACSVVQARDTQHSPTTGFKDDQDRGQFDLKVRMVAKHPGEHPPLDNLRIGAIIHRDLDQSLEAHQLEDSDDIIPGTFDKDGTSPVEMQQLPDGSMSFTGQVYPLLDQGKSDQRIDLFVFNKTEVDGWTLVSAQPCGTVTGGKRVGNMLTVTSPLGNDVAPNWKAAA